jgi:hypothetical protein
MHCEVEGAIVEGQGDLFIVFADVYSVSSICQVSVERALYLESGFSERPLISVAAVAVA